MRPFLILPFGQHSHKREQPTAYSRTGGDPPRPVRKSRIARMLRILALRHYLPTALPATASFLRDRECSTLIITYSTAAATRRVRVAVSPVEAPVRAKNP